MREEMPVGGFKLAPVSEYEALLKNKTPCMFVVDFHVPADKHDFFDWASAYSMKVTDDYLSTFTRASKEKTSVLARSSPPSSGSRSKSASTVSA